LNRDNREGIYNLELFSLRTKSRGDSPMDNSLSYADILKKTLQEATRAQPRLQAIELYPVCDVDSGHFLVLATGWVDTPLAKAEGILDSQNRLADAELLQHQ